MRSFLLSLILLTMAAASLSSFIEWDGWQGPEWLVQDICYADCPTSPAPGSDAEKRLLQLYKISAEPTAKGI